MEIKTVLDLKNKKLSGTGKYSFNNLDFSKVEFETLIIKKP